MSPFEDIPLIPPPAPGLELAPGVFISHSAVRIQHARGGGPGGQNVNKVNTKVELWIPLNQIVGLTHAALSRLRLAAGRRITDANELHLIGQSARTQLLNRQDVFERLRLMILQAQIEPKPRKKTRPSKAAKRRRLDSKHKRSELKAQRRGES